MEHSIFFRSLWRTLPPPKTYKTIRICFINQTEFPTIRTVRFCQNSPSLSGIAHDTTRTNVTVIRRVARTSYFEKQTIIFRKLIFNQFCNSTTRFRDSVKRYQSAYPNQIDDHKNVCSHGIFVLEKQRSKRYCFPPDVQLAVHIDIIHIYCILTYRGINLVRRKPNRTNLQHVFPLLNLCLSTLLQSCVQ